MITKLNTGAPGTSDSGIGGFGMLVIALALIGTGYYFYTEYKKSENKDLE